MDGTTERAPAAYLSYAEARSVITDILLAMFLAALNPHKKLVPEIAAIKPSCP